MSQLMETSLVVKQLEQQNRLKQKQKNAWQQSLLKGEYNPAKQKSLEFIHSYWTVVHTKLDGTERILADNVHNVFPVDCVDKIHTQMFTLSSLTGSGFVYLALTADTGQAINASQTALTGEITTNGLGRVLAGSRVHTNDSNTTVLEHTFTLSGTQADVTRAALFDTAVTGGIMGPFAAFTGGATGQMVNGETLKVTVTITTS